MTKQTKERKRVKAAQKKSRIYDPTFKTKKSGRPC
jgi:hypothetical protein